MYVMLKYDPVSYLKPLAGFDPELEVELPHEGVCLILELRRDKEHEAVTVAVTESFFQIRSAKDLISHFQYFRLTLLGIRTQPT